MALDYLERKGKAEAWTAGTVLLKRGDRVRALYAVLSGIVEGVWGTGKGRDFLEVFGAAHAAHRGTPIPR